jgi:oligosaccharide repeat unit polymerase
MSAVAWLCFLAAAVILGTALRRGADWFSPARLFATVWAVAIGLADLKFSRLQHTWDLYAWFALALPLLSFLAGILVASIPWMNAAPRSLGALRAALRDEPLRESVLFRLTLVLFSCYSAAFLLEWALYGTLPLFAAFPDKAKEQIVIFGVHLFINTLPAILFLVFQYLLFVPGRRGKKVTLVMVFLLAAGSYFFMLNRLLYVFFFIMALVTAYYATRRVRPHYLALIIPSFVMVLGWLQSFREVRYVRHFFHAISGMRYSEDYAAFTMPYMYIVMNLENFARAVVQLDRHSFGLFTFDWVMALTGLKHTLATYLGLQERVYLISGYNTFPFFWPFYYDFHLPGLLVLPLVFGVFAGFLYRRLRHAPSVRYLVWYSIAVFAMMLSFFTHALALLNVVINVVIVAGVQFFAAPGDARGTPGRTGGR